MATPEQAQQEQDDFSASYAKDEAQKPEMSDDEAFGLNEEPDAESPAEDAGEPAEEPQDTAPAESADGSQPTEAPSVAIVIDPTAGESGNVGGEEPMTPEDIQREKSWMGRLKAKEAELKAREDALKSTGEPSEPGETQAQESAEPQVTEAIEDAVEKVESGEITCDQAMQSLANDFGPDFAKMLGVLIEAKDTEIAGKTADEKVGAVRGDMQGLVQELNQDRAKNHYESISEAHPDFVDVAGSPEFRAFIESMPDDQQAQALQVIRGGNARQINALLTAYKAAKQPTDESAMDAAEGVRSKGVKIPEKPKQADDYEAAWADY